MEKIKTINNRYFYKKKITIMELNLTISPPQVHIRKQYFQAVSEVSFFF